MLSFLGGILYPVGWPLISRWLTVSYFCNILFFWFQYYWLIVSLECSLHYFGYFLEKVFLLLFVINGFFAVSGLFDKGWMRSLRQFGAHLFVINLTLRKLFCSFPTSTVMSQKFWNFKHMFSEVLEFWLRHIVNKQTNQSVVSACVNVLVNNYSFLWLQLPNDQFYQFLQKTFLF